VHPRLVGAGTGGVPAPVGGTVTGAAVTGCGHGLPQSSSIASYDSHPQLHGQQVCDLVQKWCDGHCECEALHCKRSPNAVGAKVGDGPGSIAVGEAAGCGDDGGGVTSGTAVELVSGVVTSDCSQWLQLPSTG
jgi:hypothetical protein